MDKPFSTQLRTLTDTDISSRRSMTRRSLLGAMGVTLGAAAVTVVGAGPGAAQMQGCTDMDFGANQDPPGYGRNCSSGPQAGCTDSDFGASQDPPGAGVRCGPPGGKGSPTSRPKGCTDSDSGANQDPVGLGVRCWV
jgi:hypothetical protein